MADELLGLLGTNDLAAFNQSALQSDPYGMSAGVLGSWRPNTSTWSPGTTAATAFGQAFLTGLLGNYARQNAAEQTNAVIGVLPQLRADPMSVAVPEGVSDQAAFARLKASAVLRNQLASEQRNQALAEMLQKVGIAGLTKKAEVLGENEAYNAMGQGAARNPKSPAYQVEQDEIANAQKLDERITNARDFLKNSEEGRGLSSLKPALAQIVASLDRNDKTADLAVFTGLAKALDPVGAISDQTIKTAQDAIPYIERTFGSAKGMFTGDGTLTREAKLRILQVVADKANGIGSEYGKAVESERRRLRVLGADPSLLTTLDYTPFNISTVAGAAPPADPLSAIDAELARRGLGPDGAPLKAPPVPVGY